MFTKPLSSLFLLCTLLSPALATPTPRAEPNGDSLYKRAPGVYVCADVHWSGGCQYVVPPLGSNHCTTLDGSASSIGPDQGLSCTFYDNGVCDDLGTGTLRLRYPGNDDLTKNGWNDRVRGFSCVAA